MRIVSLLPSATEIVAALGAADRLVGVTHECDFPPEIVGLPVLTRSVIDAAGASPSAIDRHVRAALHEGSGIYALDRDVLERLNPDLVLTQELCDVCAVSYREVQAAVRERLGHRRVLSLEPTTLDEVLGSIETVAAALDARDVARDLLRRLRFRIRNVQRATRRKARPRVYAMEWLEPPFAAGHWVPEMVDLAGGLEVLGRAGQRSVPITWDEVLAAAPEVIFLMPCGFDVERTIAAYLAVTFPAGWEALPAVQRGRVYAVDANAYFSRPGPRLVDGLELIASVLHPELAYRYLADEEAVPLARFAERLAAAAR